MRIGEIRLFRNGRNPFTKEIIWILGLIIDIHEDHDPISNVCKVLLCDGIKWLNPHGSRGITDEGW